MPITLWRLADVGHVMVATLGTSLFFTASSSILEHVSTGLEAGFC